MSTGWCARPSIPACGSPKQALTALGIARRRRERAITLFRDHDEKNLLETHAIYRDEQQLIQSAAASGR